MQKLLADEFASRKNDIILIKNSLDPFDEMNKSPHNINRERMIDQCNLCHTNRVTNNAYHSTNV